MKMFATCPLNLCLLPGQSTPSAYDHMCEASLAGGFDTVIRAGPSPETRLITVGEQPAAALYRIKKVALNGIVCLG